MIYKVEKLNFIMFASYFQYMQKVLFVVELVENFVVLISLDNSPWCRLEV
jgi:hypothetical protein